MSKLRSRQIHPEGLRLIGASFLGLFLELALIRYTNANVQVVAYFNNFMILSAMLGLGYGSLLADGKRSLFEYFPAVAALVLFSMTFLDSFGYIPPQGDLITWTFQSSAPYKNLPIPVVIIFVFAANFSFFTPIGYQLGQSLNKFENRLEGYGYDLAGSLMGVATFGAMSMVGAPPPVWFGLGSVVAILLLPRNNTKRLAIGALLLLAGVFVTTLPQPGLWSPYYKVTLGEYQVPDGDKVRKLGYAVMVDKLRIQDALHFTPELKKSPLGPWVDYYELPYRLRAPGRVLVLGGGSGNDVTMALKRGATAVTVVEIDPVIVSLGFNVHPHVPYRDPRVRVVNDDARSFLRQDDGTYDLIIMNALDSHHQLPGLSTLRLESYMYTVDSFADAKKLLADDAIFIIHLSSTRPWMGERLYWSLAKAMGTKPTLLTTPQSPYDSIAFAYLPHGLLERYKAGGGTSLLFPDPGPMEKAGDTVTLATDDWPHLYLSHPMIPRTYIITLSIIILFTFLFFRYSTKTGPLGGNLHFLLLGSGFMLLETRSITKAAALFGATWAVTALVISAILMVIFFGNWLVMRGIAVGVRSLYAMLFASLLLGYAVPIEFTLDFGFAARVVMVGAWLSLPIFFAALIFSTSFDKVENPHNAFGANLLGVVTGGALEYTSLLFGLQFLYLIALLIYAGSLLALPKQKSLLR